MGKALIIIIAGTLIILSILNLNIIERNNQATGTSTNQFSLRQARLHATSTVNMNLSKLSDSLKWRQPSPVTKTFVEGESVSRVIDTVFDGRDMVKLTADGEFYGTTTTVTAIVKLPIHPFLKYAIAGGEEVTLNGGSPIFVGDYNDPTRNANIHSNKQVILNGSNIMIEGFATYVNSISIGGSPINIVPNSNPTGSPVHYKAPVVPIPNINISSYLVKATTVYNSDMVLTGAIVLGTKTNPAIIYVKGKLQLSGVVTGYGIIIAEGDIEMTASLLHSSLDPYVSKTLIISGGKFLMGNSNTTVHASVYSKDEVGINGTNVKVIGNLTSLKKVTLNNSGVTILYQELSGGLAETIFGAVPQTERLSVIHWDE